MPGGRGVRSRVLVVLLRRPTEFISNTWKRSLCFSPNAKPCPSSSSDSFLDASSPKAAGVPTLFPFSPVPDVTASISRTSPW